MPKKKNEPPKIPNIRIDGDISGQVAFGNHISQSQTEIRNSVTPAELDEFQRLLHELRTKVETEVAPDKKDAALERVQELEQAVTEEKPDLTTMEYVKKWFGKNVPALAGAVTSVIVHPIVGRLVEAGGDLLVKDFQQRFGKDSLSYK